MNFKQFIQDKKGEVGGLSNLPNVALIFLVIAIVFGIAFTVLNTQSATYGTSACPAGYTYNSGWDICQNGTTANASVSSYAYNATKSVTTGASQITGYMPTIGLVVAAVVIIGLVFGLMSKGKYG